MTRQLDLTGHRFGMLLVLGRGASDDKNVSWRCLCDCGRETLSRTYQLRSQGKRSCGCARAAAVSAVLTKHGCATGARRDGGRTGTRAYRIWSNMKDRCANPHNRSYPRYGGRGISVCREWREDFRAFLADMGEPPSARHSIDRIDVNGGYGPGNCRWSTPSEQNRNKRSNRLVTFRGSEKPLVAWAEEVGLPAVVLGWRLDHGWEIERAMTQPMQVLPKRNGRSAFDRKLTELAIAEGRRFLGAVPR